MKKQIISALIALAMPVTALPQLVMAAETVPTPAIRYTFDGDDTLADENGKNRLTILGNAEVVEDGNTGNALFLDGEKSFAQLPDNIMSDAMTVTAWVKIDKFTVWGRVFDFGTDSGENFFFAPYSGGASRAEIKTKLGTDTMDTTQETVKDKWIHYAVTSDGKTMTYYRNGRLIASREVTQSIGDMNNVANYIGKSHYDADAYLAAAVDDFCVYDTALNADEIKKVFAQGEIDPEVMLDSYSIENEQVIVGDKIDLPQTDGLEWNEVNGAGLIDVKTGAVKHTDKTETIMLTASYGNAQREYTLYVTGKKENPYTVNIDASDRSKDVSDIMWGLFFEDINSAADGGLYAEMVENGSFEDEKGNLNSWETSGDVKVNTENPMNENNSMYVTLNPNITSGVFSGGEIINDGFSGMSIEKGKKYNFSMYFRGEAAVEIILIDKSNILEPNSWYTLTLGKGDAATVENINTKYPTVDGWQKLTGEITAPVTTDNAVLIIRNFDIAPVDIDMVSLIPQDTYKGHGLRKDLMEQLEAMHPKFLRFPGGCAVEGNTMDVAWNWKDTVGDVSERKQMPNIWGYHMTYGLGFYEYFQMCEDLGTEPVPILNCGIACQVRSGSAKDEAHLVPMDKLQPYIDDALGLIAFANGTDENNEWTKLRIEMGHPEPFNMKYIGIGNEQYGEIYFERYAEFAREIHEKYPDINLVTTSGTASGGGSNNLAWNWANSNQELADLMDEHYYETADWFRTHVYRYDNYRRNTNTKVFLGEYASKGNAWYNALCEAAFMTGLERNADVVRMASYAPMFAKYGNTQWTAANMIWFNNEDYVLTPNYHVQSLFSNNKGDYSLPTEVKLNGIEKDDTLDIKLEDWKDQTTEVKNYGPVYASSVYDEASGEVIVKLVNMLDSDVNVGININNAEIVSNIAKTTIMSGDTSLENSLENKNAIAPVEGEITNASNEFTYSAKANSLNIIRLTADKELIKVRVNGSYVKFDQKPIIESGRTLVPFRAIFEKLGASVDWDGSSQTVTAVKDDKNITLKIGKGEITVNGEKKELDVAAQIVNDRTLVPVRAISESLGCKVDWDGETRTVTITN